MKNTFRFTLFVFILTSFFTLQGQTYRIEAGYLQPVRYSSEASNRNFNGVRIGGTVDFKIPKVDFMTIHTGLLYSFTFGNNTQKYVFSSIRDSVNFNTQGHYIDIPLHLTVSHELFKNKIKVFAFAGPNFNIGLYQPEKVKTTITDENGLNTLKETFGYVVGESNLYDGRLNRFNFQLEAGAGIQWWKLMVKGGYSFGINNLSKQDYHRLQQGGWYITAAYEF
ncbi:hypothetical protein D0T49_10040 [Paludibacter sp. 221]|uniref:PorT family protein n=1 Tax=Paludibacter sp. 221 TaxID=2302939 RepID=UPI0013D30022|nr:PorT family protein [Paludibacter sp. 221]NDV47385.1 hypothetical protein [Paludibacter sp. 221]